MKILLTGGLGYIGSHTAVEMINNGYDVYILDNLSNSKLAVLEKLETITKRKIPFYQIDLLNISALYNLFKTVKFDAVIHFAGLKAVAESIEKPLLYYENNVGGSINLLKCMGEFGVNRIVFSSSACVYSTENSLPYVETDKSSPVNPYGRTKYFIEEIIKDFCSANKNFKAMILRYFNPIGAYPNGLIGEDPNGIPNNLMPYISRVAFGKLDCLQIFGKDYKTPDGTCIRDYIHIMDLAKGHLLALNKIDKIKGYEIINLGTGRGYSVMDIVSAFNECCGNCVRYEFAPRRSGDIPICYASVDKAKKVLGFTAQYGIKDMCLSAYNFEKNNK